jgi:hypothetical protein
VSHIESPQNQSFFNKKGRAENRKELCARKGKGGAELCWLQNRTRSRPRPCWANRKPPLPVVYTLPPGIRHSGLFLEKFSDLRRILTGF